MLSPKVVLLRDVLEEHLDELQFLWSLRRDGLRSPTLTRRDLGRLEARIEAHADGLLVARGDLPELVGDALGSDDPLASFAAGFVLLRSGPAGARMVLEAFLAAGEEGREGLSEALSHGSLREVRDDLAACVTSAEGGLAVAAATALAIQRAPRVPSARDTRFLEDPDPRVRLSGWRLLPFLQEPPRAEVFRRGVEDDDPAVSREAVLAAAWFGAPLALETCRERARSDREDSGEWLRLVAVLGDDSDLAFVLSAAGGAGGGRGLWRLPAADRPDRRRARGGGAAMSAAGLDLCIPRPGQAWTPPQLEAVNPCLERMDAAERIRWRAARMLAGQSGESPIDPDTIQLADRLAIAPDGRSVTLAQVAHNALHHTDQEQIMAVASFMSPVSPPPFAAQFAEVTLDLETGAVKVDRLVMAVDSGVIVNPITASGQIEGGMTQALGYAVCEEMVYDDEGQARERDFRHYHIFRADEMPELETIFIETYEPTHPFGVKAVAEIPMDGVAPAVGNAILDASLAGAGVALHIDDNPVTPEKVWHKLRGELRRANA